MGAGTSPCYILFPFPRGKGSGVRFLSLLPPHTAAGTSPCLTIFRSGMKPILARTASSPLPARERMKVRVLIQHAAFSRAI